MVDHKDGNPLNNHVNNLRYVHHEQNVRNSHARWHNKFKSYKITARMAEEIRVRAQRESNEELGVVFGLHEATIRDIVAGKIWNPLRRRRSMNQEEWRSIPGYSAYEVNRGGQIRNRRTGHILKPNGVANFSGTIKVQLRRDDGKKLSKLVARLVAAAWLGLDVADSRNCVTYLNNDRTDVRVDNLKLVSLREAMFSSRGLRILTRAEVLRIRRLHGEGKAVSEIAGVIGSSYSVVSGVIKGRSYRDVV